MFWGSLDRRRFIINLVVNSGIDVERWTDIHVGSLSETRERRLACACSMSCSNELLMRLRSMEDDGDDEDSNAAILSKEDSNLYHQGVDEWGSWLNAGSMEWWRRTWIIEPWFHTSLPVYPGEHLASVSLFHRDSSSAKQKKKIYNSYDYTTHLNDIWCLRDAATGRLESWWHAFGCHYCSRHNRMAAAEATRLQANWVSSSYRTGWWFVYYMKGPCAAQYAKG